MKYVSTVPLMKPRIDRCEPNKSGAGHGSTFYLHIATSKIPFYVFGKEANRLFIRIASA